jgi:hypothetical protein
MKTMTSGKTILSCAIATAIGLGPSAASADTILKLKIEDVGSTVDLGSGRVFDPTLDGNDGGFSFNKIDPETYNRTTLWTGNVGAGELLWDGMANPTGSFSTGFLFSSTPFVPFTFGNNAIGGLNITNADGDAELTVNSLDFGGNFGGTINFLLPPTDPPGIQTNWLVNNMDGTYKASFQWEHLITTAEDPSGNFTSFNARWILEGTATLEDAKPTIQLIGQPDVDAAAGVPYNDAGANCLDTVDGPINGQLVTTTDPVTDLNDPQANFQMVYNCQDSANLDADEVRRNVTVTSGPDITDPVITLDACTTEQGIDCSQDGSANTNTVNTLVDKDYVDGGGSCFDNIDQDIPLTGPGADPNFTSNPFPADVDTSAATNNTPAEITFTCRDTAGNSTEVKRTVNVVADTDNPVINLNDQPQDVTISLGSAPPDLAAGITCTDTNPVDNPGGSGEPQDITSNLDFDPTSIDTNQEGDTDVTYTCLDDVGNPAEPLVRAFTVVGGQAFEIESMTISDTNNDGLAGCFRFNDINPSTCDGANRFSSDGSADDPNAGTGSATIPGKGTDLDDDGNPIGIDFGVFQNVKLISPGFLFTGFPFEPLTFNPPSEDAVPPAGFVVLAGNEALIRIDSLPFSGLYTSSKPNSFFLDPDEGTLSAEILEIDPVEEGSETRTFKYRMSWSHLITQEEDPTGQFTNFNARWLIEGVITTKSTPSIVNNPPVITSLTAADIDYDPTRIIIKDNGLVTATVVAEDPNGDNLSYQWSGPVTPIDGMTGPTLTFDSKGLDIGILTLNLTVTDDADEPLSTTGELLLDVVSEAPDPDYGDDDDDGIPNYLDEIDGAISPGRNLRDPDDPGAGEIVSDSGRVTLGSTAFSSGRYAFTVTENEIGVQDRVNRADGLGHTGGGIYDFKINNVAVGATARVVLPQAVPLPGITEYRKFTDANGWFVFGATAGNELASAKRINGECPDPDDDAYDDDLGLVGGDDCIRLTLVDGSAMDADGTRNGMISDPGTASNNGKAPTGGGISKSGCSAAPNYVDPAKRSDWWLVAGVVALLGWVRRKTRRST